MLESDSQLLRELAKKCKDAKERERLRALYVLSIGEPVEKVAQFFCVDESAIYRWIEKWQKDRTLSDAQREGRPPLLDEKDKQEIKKLVEENNPKEHGVNASFWDTKELQTHFRNGNRKISRETLRVALKGLGARYVKAQIQYPEADESQRREFAQQFIKDMKSKPDSVIVLFQDEMSAGCQPHKGYGWTFEERLEIKSPQKYGRRRLNCFGAVNPLKGEVIQMSSKESKSPAFVKFLKKVEKEYAGRKIWLYTDNLKVHSSKRTRKSLEKHPNIELRFLPPYSPDMNPQEQWWNYSRLKLLNNRNFRSTHQLATAINWFGKLTPPEKVMEVCNFEPIESLLR